MFCASLFGMNKNPSCPKCSCAHVVKNGKVKGKQRFKCKDCGYQFTRLTPRGHSARDKALAVILYVFGLSMNAIGDLLGVTTPAVLYWIRDFARKNYEKPAPGNAILIELDEMWHFLNLKKTKFGSGKHIAGKLEN